MYKVFCDNFFLCLSKQSLPADRKGVKVLKTNTINQAVELINSWLELPDKNDLDIFIDESVSIETVLSRVFKRRYAAGGVVLIENKMLTIIRNTIPDLPKGHLDKGEISEQAALREVSEETGIKKPEIISSLPTTYHCYKLGNAWILKETSWYIMRCEAGFTFVPQLDEGITAVELISEKDFDAFFLTTYRSIHEELEIDIRKKFSLKQQNK